MALCVCMCICFFLKRGEERERERERNTDAREKYQSRMCSTWEETHNPGICPDWESNQQNFSLCDDTPTK